MTSPGEELTSGQRQLRWLLLASLVCGAILLRVLEPGSFSWLPIRTSCGAAMTGLPCLLCGVTRALHHLLNAEFARALYFNWLAFPLAAGTLALCAKLLAELLLRRPVHLARLRLQLTARSATVALATILAAWVLNVALAISQEKKELLNSRGALYSLFVR